MRLLLALILTLNMLPAYAWKTWKEAREQVVLNQQKEAANPTPRVIYAAPDYGYNPYGFFIFNQLQHNAYNQFQNQYPNAFPWNNPYSNWR